MKIEHFENENGGEFVIQKDGNRFGELAYTILGDKKISADHTFVEEAFRGGDYGKVLVAELAKYARENGLKIVPFCPFVKAEFNKHHEYADVAA